MLHCMSLLVAQSGVKQTLPMVLALSTWICSPIERAAIPASLIVLSAYSAFAVINNQTATMLNLTIPPSLLAIADEVIE
jgi:hypothetical protein